MSRGLPSRIDLDRLAAMVEAGVSYRDIAQELGCTLGNVSWHCNRLGLVSKNTRCRRFSPREDRELLALEQEGLSYGEIGRRLHRRPISVQARLATLARWDEA